MRHYTSANQFFDCAREESIDAGFGLFEIDTPVVCERFTKRANIGNAETWKLKDEMRE